MAEKQIIRKIIHVDMDAFFAAVEQRDHPQYRGKPVIVGGLPDSRGVVATCSYEARRFGIHSAMPSSHAYRLCPQGIFIKPRFEAYREASAIIHQVFAEFTDLFEPLSLDEAYLDVTGQGSATRIAMAIKQKIKQRTELIASAGVSYNKFLAKIASDMDKPDGLYLITPEQGPAFVRGLPIGKFHGVGKATEEKMHRLGVRTGQDLQKWSLAELCRHFGKSGSYYYNLARGVDERPVKNDRLRKSVGVETTYEQDISDYSVVFQQLMRLLQQALKKMADKKLVAHTITIKIKYYNFVQITRSRTLPTRIETAQGLEAVFEALLQDTEVGRRKIRLLGVTLSALNQQNPSEYRQLDLFRMLDERSDFLV
ncbi:DNA polymerase IV [methane-oxidizing endosymbiont of Gigantopelta aegis]|uniref:DNA polymerase IV n=1 Tax=methane-oxidizing endosymbiont of Gigantopelta aegis TaxID=2794938 RepID=UPI0018DE1B77|nr:DNA polymerase IV [methane-oxidizing endosymbiont of Gigantopelta aegis]